MRANEYPNLVVNGDMSSNINSNVMPVVQGQIGAIQAIWTGTPTGTLKLQISNDMIVWTDYSGSSVSLTGSAGNFLWNLLSMGYNYIQLIYTASSSTGTLNATSSYKGN